MVQVTPFLSLTEMEAKLAGPAALESLQREHRVGADWRDRLRKRGVEVPLLAEEMSYVGAFTSKLIQAGVNSLSLNISRDCAVNLHVTVAPFSAVAQPSSTTVRVHGSALTAHFGIDIDWEHVLYTASVIRTTDQESRFQMFDRLKELLWRLSTDRTPILSELGCDFTHPFGKPFSLFEEVLRRAGQDGKYEAAKVDEAFVEWVETRGDVLRLEFKESPEVRHVYNFEELYRSAARLDLLNQDEAHRMIALAYMFSQASYELGDLLWFGRKLSDDLVEHFLKISRAFAQRAKDDSLAFADVAIAHRNDEISRSTASKFAVYRYVLDGICRYDEWLREVLTERAIRREVQ